MNVHKLKTFSNENKKTNKLKAHEIFIVCLAIACTGIYVFRWPLVAVFGIYASVKVWG